MKILSLAVAAAVLAIVPFATVGTASAVPMIDFDVSGAPGSSANVNNFTGSGSLTATLASGLDLETFSLAEGQSKTFDFFDLTINGGFWGTAGDFDVSATLAFDDPTGASASGNGGGFAFTTILGIFSGGYLSWDSSIPALLTTANGSEFLVDFEDGFALGFFENTETIQATVTAVSVVPAPAALPLLAGGLGILSFAGWRRTRSQAA
ncbi:hypothetical protein IWQ49_006756 [Labrenzia sp. EL_126]|nr:hypothetical protein [Labrenzia sp. EL_126]